MPLSGLLAELPNLLDPALAPLRLRSTDHSEHRVPNRPDADESQDVAAEQLQCMSAVPIAIDPDRHAEGHDDAGGLILEDRPVHRVLGVFPRDQIGLQDALDKALHKRWHVTAPK